MRLGEVPVRDHVSRLSVSEPIFRKRWPLIGNRTPLPTRLGSASYFLGEDRYRVRQQPCGVGPSGRRRARISHEVHQAALGGCLQDLGHRGLQALGGHRRSRVSPHAAHDASRRRKTRPEGSSSEAPTLMPGTSRWRSSVHRDGDYRRNDPPPPRTFASSRIDPQVRPSRLQSAIPGRPDPLVDLGAQPRDLALAHPSHAHRLAQLVDRAGGHTLDVGLLGAPRRGPSPGGPTRLRSPEVAPWRSFDLQIDTPGAGVQLRSR